MMPAHQDILIAVTSGAELVGKLRVLVVFEMCVDIKVQSLTKRLDGQLGTLTFVGILRRE